MIRVLPDERLVRSGLRRILESDAGISVVAEAGDGAVAAAARCRPDVVLMDVRMPGTDGLTATGRITAAPSPVPAAAVPKIVMLTTFDLDEYVHEALRGRRRVPAQGHAAARPHRGRPRRRVQAAMLAHDAGLV